MDATASKAIASRRGVGRVTQVLCVQEAVARRGLTIVESAGSRKPPADMRTTKHLAQKEMHECCKEYTSKYRKFYAIWLRRKRQQQHEQ